MVDTTMNDFEWDSMQKKRTARAAGKGKNNHGGASALTPKPYTNKEIETMHGPVYTVNYRKPMTYNELKKLPVELQKKYLEHLISRFDIRLGTLEYMLGKSATVLSHRNKDFWNIELSVGGKPKVKAIEEFKAWVDAGGDPVETNDAVETADETVEPPHILNLPAEAARAAHLPVLRELERTAPKRAPRMQLKIEDCMTFTELANYIAPMAAMFGKDAKIHFKVEMISNESKEEQ